MISSQEVGGIVWDIPKTHQGLSPLPFLQSKELHWHPFMGDGISGEGKFVSAPRDVFYIMAKCSDFYFFFFLDFIYLFMRDTEREAETQAGGEAGSLWEARDHSLS